MNHTLRASKTVLLAMLMAGCPLFPQSNVGQVAITEMMSAHVSPADFFELTNFGPDPAELGSYQFTDADHKSDRYFFAAPGESVLIGPGESIVFVRTNFMSEAEFRAFWGTCLSSNVQVRSFSAPGFSSFGDSLTIYDGYLKPVDSIEFGRAAVSVSFTYDATNGQFGQWSSLQQGACPSAVSNNIASPGITTGPVPLQIILPPTNATPCAGLEAYFTVQAIGMPRPRFQWYFEGQPIPGAEDQTLIVSNANSEVEGAYSVRVSNGLSNILSTPATLVLNRTFAAPVVVSPPVDRMVVEGRTARFAISVCAYPEANYQWSSGGIDLPAETNRVLFVPLCTSSMSGNVYCVRAENQFGSVSECATLYVTNISPIRITECQANPQPGCDGHNDWFEITNSGQSNVQLLGYRFSDHFHLADAQVIKRPLEVRANESIIFVKNSSVGTFFEWWGPDQLPADLQVVPYSGFSLRARGDSLYLWDETAERDEEFLDSASFSTNSLGRTINFEADGSWNENVPGERHAIEAVQCGDIGTPGFVPDSAPVTRRPEFYTIQQDGPEIVLGFRAGGLGGTYRIEFTENLTDKWSTLLDNYVIDVAYGSTVVRDSSVTNSSTRFYRILQISP